MSIATIDTSAAERRASRIRLRLDGVADSHEANLDRFRRILGEIKESVEQYGDHVQLGYRSHTEYVADRFGGAMERLGIEHRREAVGVLSDMKMSTRGIAAVTGTDHSTVSRDRTALSGVASATPDDRQVQDDLNGNNKKSRSGQNDEVRSSAQNDDVTDTSVGTVHNDRQVFSSEHLPDLQGRGETPHGDLVAGVTPGNTSTDDAGGTSVPPSPAVNTETGEVSDDYLPEDASGEEVTSSAEAEAKTGSANPPADDVEEAPGEEVEAPSGPPSRSAVTGLDGKTYTPPKKKAKPRRKPLPEAFNAKTEELGSALSSLWSLTQETERFPQNADQVATKNRSDLIRARDLLQQVIDQLPNNN